MLWEETFTDAGVRFRRDQGNMTVILHVYYFERAIQSRPHPAFINLSSIQRAFRPPLDRALFISKPPERAFLITTGHIYFHSALFMSDSAALLSHSTFIRIRD